MKTTLNWGILSTANFALTRIIPDMKHCKFANITAIASRNVEKAKSAAEAMDIPKFYGSYEELLADPDIDVIYNPLPNHMHVPWTIKAAEAGKHVLCEKPLAITADEAQSLIEVRDRTGVYIQEAFMVGTNPQWIEARNRIRNGRIGKTRSILGHFTYMNKDSSNYRNTPGVGGGGLYDIGCYLIFASRFFFDEEPTRAIGVFEWDASFGVDVLVSFMLDFPSGQAIHTCGTQSAHRQKLHIEGSDARIEIMVPFNPPNNASSGFIIDDGSNFFLDNAEKVMFEPFNQYVIQGDSFSEAILNRTPQPISLESTVNNMKVIDAIFRSEKSQKWEKV